MTRDPLTEAMDRIMAPRDSRKEEQLAETVRTKCALVLENMSSAIRYPRISVPELESAVLLIADALAAAREIDK